MLQRTDKDCTVLLMSYGSLVNALMWNDFFLDAATNLKEREFFLIEPMSTLLKLVCSLNHLSCN